MSFHGHWFQWKPNRANMSYKLSCCVLCVLALSCSIKEDRAGCPAWLTVVSDGHLGEDCENGVLLVNVKSEKNGYNERSSIAQGPFLGEGKVLLVPREQRIDVDVIGGIREMELSDSLLRIVPGNDCDCIVSGSGRVKMLSEEGMLALPLNRNYARLVMTFYNGLDAPEPYLFVLSGNVDGYLLPGMEPHHGCFSFLMNSGPGNNFMARLPRQTDSSVKIEVRRKTDYGLLSEIPVGEILYSLGYDWNSSDLNDIFLVLDFARSSIIVSVEDWVYESLFKITI